MIQDLYGLPAAWWSAMLLLWGLAGVAAVLVAAVVERWLARRLLRARIARRVRRAAEVRQ